MRAEVGFGRGDLTVFDPRMAMLGWGRPDQRPRAVGAPLFARAMTVRRDGRAVAIVCLDLCFVSAALRARVLSLLAARGVGVAPSDLLLTATHTHSGPNGFSHAFFYDLSAPGLSPRVLDGLAAGTVDAIVEALARAEPATLRLGRGAIDDDAPIAVNRSLDAYLRNPEVRGRPRARDAIDRRLTVLRADDVRGRPLGMICSFALHATSLHGDGALLHPDHKGLAALAFERDLDAPGFVAIFAQGAAGDVSPNGRFDARRGVTVGVYDDDLKSAAYVGEVQARAAREVFDRAEVTLEPPLASALRHVDLEDRPVPTPFARAGARTTPGRLGLAMAAGTAEGPGPLAALPARVLAGGARRAKDDPKRVLLSIGAGRHRRLFDRIDPTRAPLPHPAFARARRLRADGALEHAWIPTVLPIQLLQLGRFAIVALPNEPTTIAGARLARLIEATLGVEHALVLGYSNAYAGYLTTPEEYALQRYEGAYTLFGPHTLGAFAAELHDLARRLPELDGSVEAAPPPLLPPAAVRARAQ